MLCIAMRKPRCGSPDRPARGGGPNSRRVADPSAAVSCSSERCTRPRTDNGLGDTADPAQGQDPRGALGGRSPWSSPSPDAQRHGARGGRRAAVPPRQPVFRFCFLPPGRAWRRGAPWPGRVTGKRRECGGLAGPVGGGVQGRTGLHGAGGGVLPGGFPESVMASRLPATRPRPAGTRGSHGRGGLAEPLVRPSVSAMRRAAQPGCTRAASPGCFSASAVRISRARPSHCPVPCGT